MLLLCVNIILLKAVEQMNKGDFRRVFFAFLALITRGIHHNRVQTQVEKETKSLQ